MSFGRRDRQLLRTWLAKYLADVMDLDPSVIHGSTRFDQMGLVATTSETLCSDLSEWLGESLAPELLAVYPSIDDLVNYLTSEHAM